MTTPHRPDCLPRHRMLTVCICAALYGMNHPVVRRDLAMDAQAGRKA